MRSMRSSNLTDFELNLSICKWRCSGAFFVPVQIIPFGFGAKRKRRTRSRSGGCRFQRVRHEILPSADSLSSLSFSPPPGETQLLTRLDFRLQSCPTPPFIISSFHHCLLARPHRASQRRGYCVSFVRDKNKRKA